MRNNLLHKDWYFFCRKKTKKKNLAKLKASYNYLLSFLNAGKLAGDYTHKEENFP